MQSARKRLRRYVTGDESKRVRDHIKEKSAKPQYLKLIDKISFTLGVLNISICQYFLCNQPKSFWVWYSVIIPILLYSRMKHFKRKGWHYFLLDFCYFTLICSFINLYIFPSSSILFKIIFIYANGPLTWAIVLWRNSFVFHDYDKITSVYIHILPSILTYTLKWYDNNNTTNINNNKAALSMVDYISAAVGYLVWQGFYYLKTEYLDKEKLDSNPNLLTSLRWLSKDEKNFAARKVLWLCRRMGLFEKREKYDSTTMKTKCVFMATQFSYTLLTFVPTYALYHSETLHFCFIAGIMTISIFYGASYYIEVFSERYHLQFKNEEGIKKFAQNAAEVAYETMRVDAHTNTPVFSSTATAISGALDHSARKSFVVNETAAELTENMLSMMEDDDDGTSTPVSAEMCD